MDNKLTEKCKLNRINKFLETMNRRIKQLMDERNNELIKEKMNG